MTNNDTKDFTVDTGNIQRADFNLKSRLYLFVINAKNFFQNHPTIYTLAHAFFWLGLSFLATQLPWSGRGLCAVIPIFTGIAVLANRAVYRDHGSKHAMLASLWGIWWVSAMVIGFTMISVAIWAGALGITLFYRGWVRTAKYINDLTIKKTTRA